MSTSSAVHILTLQGVPDTRHATGNNLHFLQERLCGISWNNLVTMVTMVKDIPHKNPSRLGPTDLHQEVAHAAVFPSSELESIYKLQLWQVTSYPDDVLRDMVISLRDHLVIYKHLFSFHPPSSMHFLKRDKAILELGKAAIWLSEILRTLSQFIPCVPIFLIFLIIEGYNDKDVVEMVAPDFFLVDVIQLFPELFPICDLHKGCTGCSLKYPNVAQVTKNREFKLLGAILLFSDLSLGQLRVLVKYCAFGLSYEQVLEKGKFLFSLNDNVISLRKESVDNYQRRMQDFPALGAAVPLPAPRRGVKVREIDDPQLKSRENLIIECAERLFKTALANKLSLSTVFEQVNAYYYDISDEGLSQMDFMHALQQGNFTFSNDNTMILYTG